MGKCEIRWVGHASMRKLSSVPLSFDISYNKLCVWGCSRSGPYNNTSVKKININTWKGFKTALLILLQIYFTFSYEVTSHSEFKLLFNWKDPNFNSIARAGTLASIPGGRSADSLQLEGYRVLGFGFGFQIMCDFRIII